MKGCRAVAGVIDLGTVEIFPIFRAIQKGLIDQDTGLMLLECQVIMSGLIAPETGEKLSLERGLSQNLINPQMYHQLRELQDVLSLINTFPEGKGPLSVVKAIENKTVSERVGLKILGAHLATGGFILYPSGNCITLQEALHQGLITPQLHSELESYLRSSKNLIDPNTAEKISLLDLMQRCIVHQESGLKLLPVKQLAGGMLSLKSGRKVSIFRAVQEGLIDRQVTVRLLEAQLFAGGIVDPRTGHRLTVEEAVKHNLIDQDMACAILIRQLQTGGIIDTATGHRLTINEAVSSDLIAAKIALVILESLWSFMGLLWPESGEILPITDALEQGIVSTELAHKILSGRQHINALFLPTTTEVWSWEEAIENGIFDKGLADSLKSVCIPDVIPHMQLADSSERSKASINPGAAPLLCSKDKSEAIASHKEKLLFQLMTHSYINVQDGQRLLLLDKELIDTLTLKDESQVHPSELFGCGPQRLDTSEELNGSSNMKVTEAFCDGLMLKPCEFPFSSQNKELPDQKNCTEMESRKTITELEVSARKNVNSSILTVPPKEAENLHLVIDKDPFSVETPKQCQTFRKTSFTYQREQASAPETEHILGESAKAQLKPQGEKSQFQVEKSLSLESELKSENDMNIHSLDKKKVVNKQVQERESISGHKVMMLARKDDEDNGVETSLPCSHPSELLEETTLDVLSAQLLDGGIFHEQTGQKLLLNEAIAQGIVSSHTAVKLMEKFKMFRGFFDCQTQESLTTAEVIDEGLMDEKLLQKVLKSDKAISGVLDPRTHTLFCVNDAVAVGLLDKQTANRILEGQVVTGGIVDIKRGKKVSVTLASNLGLVDSADQRELVSLEKASKGRDAGKTIRERLISLQIETTGIMDPDTKAPLTFMHAIDRGLLERQEAVQLLTKQVVDGGIIHHVSGIRLSVDNAFKHGLIDEDLSRQLRKVENVNLHQFYHPETNEAISLPEAIKLDLITPDLKKEIQEIQALTGTFVDLLSGQRLTIAEAEKEGLLTNKAILSSEMMRGIVDPENYRIVPYSELVKKCKIDIESGQRYLEVIPFSDIKDGVSGKVLTLSEAAQLGKLDFACTLRVLEAQANTGGIIDTTTGKRLTLASALEQKMVDENMAKIIASHQVLKGGIIDIFNDQRVNLREATEKRLITPELATMIQIDSLEPSDVRAQIEKQDGIEVCELNNEFLQKEMSVACNQTAEMSCGERETEKLFQSESLSADAMTKIRFLDEEQAENIRKVLLKESQYKDKDKRRASPDFEGSANVMISGNGKIKSLDCISVAHPHSELCTFKLKEVVWDNIGENTNEEQEKIVTQGKMISHVKPSTSDLGSNKIRENQREMISEVQESNCETSVKFLNEQPTQKPMNTKVKTKREKEAMILEESVKICKLPEGLSEEKLKKTAVSEEHDSTINSQPVEITTLERGKEIDRELGFSIICKGEESSSEMISKRISKRNQDALTFFNSQANKGEANLSVCLPLKPEENLFQEITGESKGEPFLPVTPGSEGFQYQESIGKTQGSDKLQISKADKSVQRTTRHETNCYQDSCASSKTKERTNLTLLSKECKEKSHDEVTFDPTRALKLEEIFISRVVPKEVSYLEFTDRKDLHQDSQSDHELSKFNIATIQEMNGDQFLEMGKSPVTTSEAGFLEGIVTPEGSRVSRSVLPEELLKDVTTQKEITGQQDVVSPTVLETSTEKTVPLMLCPTKKTDEKTPQEKLGESTCGEQPALMTISEGRENEDVIVEPFKANMNVYNRQLCLEHDEKLVSYLSLLRDIEMRTKQIQPLELNLTELQDLLCQAEVLDRELKDLSTLVNQELECVNWIIISQPPEVPAQLLKALEKDAKNLQKSLSSVTATWSYRLPYLQNAVDVKRTEMLNQQIQLEGRLQDLKVWVDNTHLTLNNKEYNSETDANSLNHCLQQYEDLKQPITERKSQLAAITFDIQFFITENAQNLSPQQNQQMMRLLNELLRSFEDLVQQSATQMNTLQSQLLQLEQAAQVKIQSAPILTHEDTTLQLKSSKEFSSRALLFVPNWERGGQFEHLFSPINFAILDM
ncbi:microtubule-actin cross-linking factor 1, isoforms 1/2/3/4/5-like [Rhynchocyon petersi]